MNVCRAARAQWGENAEFLNSFAVPGVEAFIA
jgi:hypothetical protein